MLTLINGQQAEVVPVQDRALAYGDGVFETLRLHGGRAVFLEAHLQRMATGCAALGIPFNPGDFRPDTALLLRHTGQRDAVLKLMVSRGSGGRGYRPGHAVAPVRIASLHALPALPEATGGKAFLCRQRLGSQPVLAGIKHLNRLEQVLASMEWPDDSFSEGLMLDYADHAIEGTRSNVFIACKGRLLTPVLDQCGIAGIFRQHLLQSLGPAVAISRIHLETVQQADEMFFCNSVTGVRPVTSLYAADQVFRYQPGAFTTRASELFISALQTC